MMVTERCKGRMLNGNKTTLIMLLWIQLHKPSFIPFLTCSNSIRPKISLKLVVELVSFFLQFLIWKTLNLIIMPLTFPKPWSMSLKKDLKSTLLSMKASYLSINGCLNNIFILMSKTDRMLKLNKLLYLIESYQIWCYAMRMTHKKCWKIGILFPLMIVWLESVCLEIHKKMS